MSGDKHHKAGRGRPFEADGEKTRAAILDGARECFARLGYADATNKRIAEVAGVSASSIYNYFGSKLDIYRAIVDEGELYISQAYEAAVAEQPSPLQGLIAIFDCNIAIYQNRPDLPPFFGHLRSETSRNTEIAEFMQGRAKLIRPIIHGLVVDAQRQGEINPAAKAENIEMMLSSVILGLSLLGLQVDSANHIANIRAFKTLLNGELLL